jgi:formylglycine-generating enzyme required for sulfatase activity
MATLPTAPRPALPSKSTVIVVIAATAVALGSLALTTLGMQRSERGDGETNVSPPETVAVAPRSITYRAAGEYLRGTTSVDAPLMNVSFAGPLHIMRYQVSIADYTRCVDAGVCLPQDARAVSSTRVPVTGVSFDDAQRYASWLSETTGQVWRLPTDEEWVLAAASRFIDDALGIGDDANNPSKRWLAQYQREAERDAEDDGEPKPPGFYGRNEHGLWDLAGNVWEWTDTCYVRASVDADGTIERVLTTNCGVRVVEGRHRSYMTDFIRDAKSGGCAVGTPPDNLGFRLVRESTHRRLMSALQEWWRRDPPNDGASNRS